MNFKALFKKHDLDKIKINLKLAEAEIRLNTSDENAAWGICRSTRSVLTAAHPLRPLPPI